MAQLDINWIKFACSVLFSPKENDKYETYLSTHARLWGAATGLATRDKCLCILWDTSSATASFVAATAFVMRPVRALSITLLLHARTVQFTLIFICLAILAAYWFVIRSADATLYGWRRSQDAWKSTFPSAADAELLSTAQVQA